MSLWWRLSSRARLTLRYVSVTIVAHAILIGLVALALQQRPATLVLVLIDLPIGALAAGVAAWLVTRQVMTPIQELSEAVRQVTPETIEEPLETPAEDASAEVMRLQQELTEALDRVAEGYRAQDRFIGNVAHELKTPIAVLLAQAQVLRSTDASTSDHETFRQSVEDEMQYLGSLVEGFLTLARADPDEARARRERTSVHDTVLESVTRCSAEASQRGVGIALRLSEPGPEDPFPELDADPELLTTMTENLLRNAVRFSPPGGKVDVDVTSAGDDVTIVVRDRGPGIPPEIIDRVFDRFARACEDSGRSKGTGLGLAIAQRVAEVHGGRIDVENCEEAGCAFRVRLPLAPG